ncbi:RagB/SusD family nutrient uptake outer membrane protein [Flavobacterium faecale]|uniref:RagB/SusD family nutrient uptake outer membrane protein n=1 Tax=Flavobacterium faecale TaxID=1355330 RepID=A0A2S1LIJ7_9FLAO|nr:RagB/SusD family nutrient uptake outer membrane protein [Flavobacterium faecale]AWG23306.1 RagB/SusD family nutrient uptake outer membrane protein [Flavobacterium faecale]
MKSYKKIKKSIVVCSVLALGSLVSCNNDYLDVGVYGTPEVDSFYKSPVDAEQGITAAYSPMREQYGRENFLASTASTLLFGDIGTDDLLKGGARSNDGPQLFEKETYALTTSNTAAEAIWKVNFKGVLYANLVLAKVPAVDFTDANRKKEILAEAHFLRAYYYYYLVNTFGGVPLIDKPLEQGAYNVARSSKAETYTFIENDLKAAIADLPSRFAKPATYLGHADKGAALGLMMRVSLYQNKMGQVKTYGEQLFATPYVLADYTTIFRQEGEWNSGSIFEINMSSNASSLGTYITSMMTPRNKGGIGFGQIQPELRNEFEVNDPRLAASFYTVTGNYGTDWYNKKYSWAPYSNYAKPTTGGTGNSANNIRIIRLADAYLMYAEAIYKVDPATAVTYVNKVRKRARGTQPITVVPDLIATLSGDALRDAIYHERRVELAGEGLRFQDLIRTGRAKALLSPLGFVENKNEVMPIPYSQTELSQGVLLQNNY